MTGGEEEIDYLDISEAVYRPILISPEQPQILIDQNLAVTPSTSKQLGPNAKYNAKTGTVSVDEVLPKHGTVRRYFSAIVRNGKIFPLVLSGDTQVTLLNCVSDADENLTKYIASTGTNYAGKSAGIIGGRAFLLEEEIAGTVDIAQVTREFHYLHQLVLSGKATKKDAGNLLTALNLNGSSGLHVKLERHNNTIEGHLWQGMNRIVSVDGDTKVDIGTAADFYRLAGIHASNAHKG